MPRGVVSVTTIQVEQTSCPIIFLETMGSLLGDGVSVIVSFLHSHFNVQQASEEFEDHNLLN